MEEGDECELARKLKLCFKQHAPEYGIKSFMGLDFADDDYESDSSESDSDEYQ